MKKIMELVKPFLALILGVLMFLYYLNGLSGSGVVLASGILGVIFGSYYICVGVLNIVVGSKLPVGARTAFDILSVSLFPAFMFYIYLIFIIYAGNMGPTGWVINILSLVASISLCVVYVASRFAKSPVLVRLASLFGIIFVLSLICDLIFTTEGNSEFLGTIEVVLMLGYAAYTALLLNSLKKEKAE